MSRVRKRSGGTKGPVVSLRRRISCISEFSSLHSCTYVPPPVFFWLLSPFPRKVLSLLLYAVRSKSYSLLLKYSLAILRIPCSHSFFAPHDIHMYNPSWAQVDEKIVLVRFFTTLVYWFTKLVVMIKLACVCAYTDVCSKDHAICCSHHTTKPHVHNHHRAKGICGPQFSAQHEKSIQKPLQALFCSSCWLTCVFQWEFSNARSLLLLSPPC